MTTSPPTLTPEMLLFEVAAMCSRHGIPVSTSNPGAAVEHATRLLQTLGVMPHEPVAIEATPTAEIARVPAEAWTLPAVELPHVPAPTRGVDGFSFRRGQHRPGAPRSLRSVKGGA